MAARKLSNTRRISGRRLAALSAAGAGACLAMLVATGPSAAKVDPPAPADVVTSPVPTGPPNYTNYRAATESTTVGQETGLDATSIGLGVLGGLALGATGLGVARTTHRRRDHDAASPA